MAFAPQAIISSNSLFFFNNNKTRSCNQQLPNKSHLSRTRAASTDDPDCNVEECAPDKEVGKVSGEWLAGEKTKVVGTFPPRKRGWTGYVEKDTAGQTNIYSIEPTVYVAETAISSGTAGSSSEGAENTVAVTAGIALVTIAAAASLLIQLGKNAPPTIQTVEYSGPSLTYYINKFKPPEKIIEISVSTEPETVEVVVQTEAAVPEGTTIQVESEIGEASSSVPDVALGY